MSASAGRSRNKKPVPQGCGDGPEKWWTPQDSNL